MLFIHSYIFFTAYPTQGYWVPEAHSRRLGQKAGVTHSHNQLEYWSTEQRENIHDENEAQRAKVGLEPPAPEM